eukprot:gnl/TRDRNA2_/TRDRNA2_165683_c2_seq2.p1 gnl/TRDRNA2_/TRDRNA2_165683_c2~~gnl/TRDRNA2_/TRDRNA2_165683_c2_seq2.p1  ORF type:complete len:381 (+),score=68.14 gnl/TRDRNA2_/TRDRNA2_165683_c2_seq2:88-1143(+)
MEARLVIYDPYFCSGRMKELVAELGFPKVINRKRDFYQDVSDDALPRFDVLLTNPPYSGDHKERLFQVLLDRQRSALLHGKPEPYLLLLPSWTVDKAFTRRFLQALAKLHNKEGSEDQVTPAPGFEEAAAKVFYVCRRGMRGRPAKYAFDHLEGAGLPRSPFFGVWICGGFGNARATAKAAKRAAQSTAEGFWEGDGQWYPCRPSGSAAGSLHATTGNGSDVPSVEVTWIEDGTVSTLRPNELRGGVCVFTSMEELKSVGLLRTQEDVRRRQEENPKQQARRQAAIDALKRKRDAVREAHGGKRKRGPDKRQYVVADADNASVPKAVARCGAVCHHFFSAKGCSRGVSLLS